MLTAVWHILTTGQPYQDLGGDYYTRRRPGAAIVKALNQLRAAGIELAWICRRAVLGRDGVVGAVG